MAMPTSALDPRSTTAVEELIQDLGEKITIVLVTHNHAQADKVCSRIARLAAGRLEGEQHPQAVICY